MRGVALRWHPGRGDTPSHFMPRTGDLKSKSVIEIGREEYIYRRDIDSLSLSGNKRNDKHDKATHVVKTMNFC